MGWFVIDAETVVRTYGFCRKVWKLESWRSGFGERDEMR